MDANLRFQYLSKLRNNIAFLKNQPTPLTLADFYKRIFSPATLKINANAI
jgi:hypothetical protein